MPHKLIGTVVIFKRSVIVKEAHTRQGDAGKPNTFVPSEVQMIDTPALVIGVGRADELSEAPAPLLTLAFVHPDRLHGITGAGWREAIDRAINVLPQTDKIAMAEPLVPRWRELDDVDLCPVVKKPKPTPVLPTPVKPEAKAEPEKEEPAETPEPEAKKNGKSKT